MKVLITGSCGLIGSEAVHYYNSRADLVVGVDNNMRSSFFGKDGDTVWMRQLLEQQCGKYRHAALDIRDSGAMSDLMREVQPGLIIHCAAQPSHDLAAKIPFTDFEVNAQGTLNLLEAFRARVPESVFVFMSTNKVYGDAPNAIALRELDTRWDYGDPAYEMGIPETFSIDQSKHSLFGASKVAADILVQEYGRYFGLKTVCFRGGCLTGSRHSGAELHGFLSYFFKTALTGKPYTIFGYKGKQVRDQIHSFDVVSAFDAFYQNPSCGAVYNLGGGKENSVSILEAIDWVESVLGNKMHYEYSDQHRSGDHICYYSDLTRFKTDYPGWGLTYSLKDIFEDMAQCVTRMRAAAPFS